MNNSLAIKWLKAGELALGTIDTFLIWKMSGGEVFATEHSNASRTLLYDLRSRQYSQELCGIFEVTMESLPTIQSSIGRFGVTKGVHGLPDGIPITGCLGDQQAALYGQNCFAPGEGKITFGTGTFLLMNLGSKPVLSDKGLLTSVALSSGSEFTYCLEGSSFIAGAAIQYLRDKFGWVQSGADSDKVALSEERDPNLIFIPAFAGLAAPYWNSNARACLIGLSLKSSKAQVVRAVLESIVLQNVQLFDLVSECLKRPIKRLAVDGGVARSDFLMQLQADLLQAPLVRPGHAEATARGAALAARQGLDPSLTVPELESPVVFKPKMTTEKSRSIKEPWLKAATKVHEYYSG
ncbi:MAG: hypothetical protein DCC75_01505 [Proteobacteria bacterium]|nr:MAG: hypothetical protein DCC75_01505 [Pseudomonadota bacterium]